MCGGVRGIDEEEAGGGGGGGEVQREEEEGRGGGGRGETQVGDRGSDFTCSLLSKFVSKYA